MKRIAQTFARIAVATMAVTSLAQAQVPSPDEVRERRLAQAAAPGFHPGDMISAESNAIQEFRHWASRGRAPQAQETMVRLLKQYPYSLPAHQSLANLYEQLKSEAKPEDLPKVEERLKLHQDMVRTVEDSILHGTECAKPEDHCRVISPVEIRWVGERLQCKKPKTAKERHEGVPFQVDTCENGRVVYYDLTSYPADWQKP